MERKFKNSFSNLTFGLFSFVFVASLCFQWIGCSSKPVDETNPAEVYKDAEGDLDANRFALALDKFRKVKNKFPYSNYSAIAQLKIADTFFKQEAYADAAVAYETFRDLHPKHEKAPYAFYQIGEAYFKDIPNPIARDLGPAKKSMEAFKEFMNRYPNDPIAADAKNRISQVRSTLAQKELYVGNFYYKQNHYKAAKIRYQNLLKDYPDTPSAEEAKTKLGKAEKNLKEEEESK